MLSQQTAVDQRAKVSPWLVALLVGIALSFFIASFFVLSR